MVVPEGKQAKYFVSKALDLVLMRQRRKKVIHTMVLNKGTGLKASLMSYLTKLKEFQFPKQPSPKQQLEPIQLMKEDLPSRKGLKAS
ncbi:hypothetical protein Tco_1214968 [Tanacetum coccineum]